MTARRCQGTSKSGEPCKAAPLEGRDHCSAHDRYRPDSDRFGSPEWSSRAGASPRLRAQRLQDALSAAVDERHPEIVARLVSLAVEGDVRALVYIFDRIIGRPRQALEHVGKGGGPIEVKDAAGVDLRKLSNDELDQLERLLLRARPEPVPWSPDADKP
jgi:hypothetical protein